MGIDLKEMQRIAGVIPMDDDFVSYREAARPGELPEDLTSGMRGWLKGVLKSIATWKGKMSKEGASSGAITALNGLEASVNKAIGSLGESTVGKMKHGMPAYEDAELSVDELTALAKAFVAKLKELRTDFPDDVGKMKAIFKSGDSGGIRSYRYSIPIPKYGAVEVVLSLSGAQVKIPMTALHEPVKKGMSAEQGAEATIHVIRQYIDLGLKSKKKSAAAAPAMEDQSPDMVEAHEGIRIHDAYADHQNWADAMLDEAKISPRVTGFEKGVNTGTKVCKLCGKKTWKAAGGGSDLCKECYDAAGLVNEHEDGHHDDAPDEACPLCQHEAGEHKGHPMKGCPRCAAHEDRYSRGQDLVESEEDKARKIMIMGLWKKFQKQLQGTGYARIDGKKHVVRMKPGGELGDMIDLMDKGKDTALEDMSDEELKAMFLKSVKWLAQFEGPWVKKNIEVIKSLLPSKA